MALFKQLRGNRTSLDAQPLTDGYAYFCVDDGTFHIDFKDENGVLQRKQINAKDAESLCGMSLDEIKAYVAENTGAPTKLSDLTDDSTHRLVTDTEKSTWNAKANTSDIPTKVSQLTNDSKFLTSVPSEYITESELTAKNYALKSEIPSVPVQSVNNKTGAVSLTASDVGALPSTTTIPTKLSDLTTDATHRVVTDTEKSTWNSKANPSDIPTKTSQLSNDSGYLTSAPVTKVNNKTGAVTLTASDVGADASGTANSAVSSHNTNTSAHADIRTAIDGKANKSEGAFFIQGSGTTDSTAKTSTWTGSSDRITEYYDGLTIRYKIGVAGQTTTTLNINGLGAKTVYLFNTTKLTTQFPVNSIINLIYHKDLNSGCWVCSDYDSNTNTYQRIYPSTDNVEYPITARYNTTTGSSYYAEYGRYSTGVTLNPSTNTITATKFKGALTGNADTATKATQDASGNVITSTYETKADATTKLNQINSQISQLSSEIVDLDTNIPDYVIEEAEATISKLFSHGNLGRTIRFIAISDTHEDSAEAYNPQITISNKHAGQAIKYISDRIGLDFVAHLGDASSCGAWSTSYEFDVLCNDIKNINKFVFSGIRGIKNAFVPGNHDMISMNGVSLLNSGAYTLFGNMCSGNKDRLGGYGYFDIDDAKVRVIYLNTSDSPSSAAYLALTQAQKNWLCETLIDVNTKDDADEWKVILLSHAPLDFGGANISTDILLPYVNGESYNSYSFNGKNSAKIISNIHGHVHCFSYGYIADKIRRFTIPNACFVGANHYSSRTEYANWADTVTYNKTANSGKDTSFALVTIDLDSGKCYVDNYGAGIDRVFSTDYKPIEVIVPTSISNISYSGVTTVGKTIDKSKFTFTVTYSNGTTKTVTGATSVSPTTISKVGNNTVTITYTEDGVSITGTVTIVGTAVPSYSVTNNLTNCVNSNSASTINEGSSYSATITAKDGYTLDSVTVTMGGSSVSVTNGVISISNVTGAIVITANAVANAPRNEISTSVDTDETTVYNRTGYALNTRLGSDGTTRANASNCVTSGLIPYNGQGVELVIPTTSPNGNAYLHLYLRYNNALAAEVPFDLPDGTQADGSRRQIPYWVSDWGVSKSIVGSTTVLTIPASIIAQADREDGTTLYLRVSSNIDSGVTVNDSTFRLSFI